MKGVFADQIRFSYRSRLALSNVSFELSPGVTGLLGPNGAGKSTLMNLLATVRRQQSGTLTLGGFDSVRERDEARRITGYLPQRFELLPTASVLRNVEYAAWARGLPMAEAARAAEEILVVCARRARGGCDVAFPTVARSKPRGGAMRHRGALHRLCVSGTRAGVA